MSSLLPISIAIGIFLISLVFYRHDREKYAEGKTVKIESRNSFSYVYRYLQVSTLLFVIFSYASDSAELLELYSPSFFVLYGGLLLSVIGTVFFVAAKQALGKSYSPCFDSFVPQKVVQLGVYKYVRHPIYTANILIILGFFISTGSAWLLVNLLILTWYYVDAAKTEEITLREHLPGYEEYYHLSGRFFPRITLFRRSSKLLKD